ncbi:O-methyltransferase, family II [Desulfosarcina variabilis str. Montpellier]|uniref:SAM-dependent methyltransferase n=1 Tax=Desulfosarcina variabilis TaxID=2300 RepID=UPI003AFB6E51
MTKELFSDNSHQDVAGAAWDANKLAMAPMAFQAIRLLWKKGVLSALEKTSYQGGSSIEALEKDTGVSRYGLTVLLEAGLAEKVVKKTNDKYRLSKIGFVILNDKATQINFDFAQDVCYQAMFHLEEAIDQGKPSGLKVFGQWPTIYRALTSLPEPVKTSWFAFDHHYSDSAFSRALEIVFSGETKPRTLLDIGGNTGKWSLRCAEHDKDVRITVVDLPEQVSVADQNVRDAGQSDRIDFFPVDLLDDASSLPENRDAAWMSQFLCCFSESQIVSILTRTRKALNPDGRVFILDTFWDHQRLEVSAYCLIMTSLYFTCLANGNSRMYDGKTMLRLIDQAGLELVSEHRNLGLSHSLLVCKKKSK